VTYYYFSDNQEFEFTAELIESAKLGSLCSTAQQQHLDVDVEVA